MPTKASSKPPARILVLRFGAMGDLVLTTPVLRTLAKGLPATELHLLVKPAFADVLASNPHLTAIHTLRPRWADTLALGRSLGVDYVLDLQKNLRSRRIVGALGLPSSSFPKYNLTKWRMTALKHRREVPHVVVRYGRALQPLGLALDGAGLDFHLMPEPAIEQQLAAFCAENGPYVAVALGATHFTKRWPTAYFAELLTRLHQPAVLLGGPAEQDASHTITQALGPGGPPLLNLVGQTSLMGSAHAVAQAAYLITHDTGLMHIGAALGKRTVSLWGNTVPGFGMAPYQTEYIALEVPGLKCRPCTKIGYSACPKGHFKCMRELTPQHVSESIQQTGWC